MKIQTFRRSLVKQLGLLPKSPPLTSLRFIGQIFLATIFLLWTLWLVDALQQRDVLYFMTGGGKALEEVSVLREENSATLLKIQPRLADKEEGNGSGSGSGEEFTFTVNRDGDTGQESTVEWSVGVDGLSNPADRKDFQLKGGRFPNDHLIFKEGEPSKTITIKVLGDKDKEADETFRVSLRNSTNAKIAGEDSAIGTIKNDDGHEQSNPNWSANWLYSFAGIPRLPVLILLGIIAPLAMFLWNWKSAIYIDTLKPYLMLLGAQAGSVVVGVLLLGEGMIPFIGVIYSGLRVLQIKDLLVPTPPDLRPIPGPLKLVLRSALVLWFLNMTALALHILWVTIWLVQGQGVA